MNPQFSSYELVRPDYLTLRKFVAMRTWVGNDGTEGHTFEVGEPVQLLRGSINLPNDQIWWIDSFHRQWDQSMVHLRTTKDVDASTGWVHAEPDQLLALPVMLRIAVEVRG